MSKAWVIAAREYRTSVRSKAFIISLVLMPIFMLGGIWIPDLLRGRVDVTDKKILVLDATGRVLAALTEAAQRYNETETLDEETGKQVEARIVIEAAQDVTMSDDARLARSERVRRNEITAFLEIDADALTRPPLGEPPARFYSESVGSRGISRWLARTINQTLAAERLREANIDPALVASATAPVEVDVLGLYDRGSGGEIRKAEKDSRSVAMIVPIAILMLMFMSIMMAQVLLQSTLEEKQQRIAEVLLGSATPFQIMLGKLLGNVGLSVTMVGLYLVGGYFMARHNGYEHMIPMHLIGWFLAFQVFGLLIYGSIFAAIGAACSDLKDAQSLLMPVMLVLVFPMMVWFKVLEEPTSSFSTWLSLFPPATPMLMIVRLAATKAIPLWQPLLGLLIVALSALACIWAGSRIFRVGLLMQGKPPKLAELARWAIRG